MRFPSDPRVQQLASVAVLDGTSASDRAKMCRLTTALALHAGDRLCSQGAYAQEVFLILSGEVAVYCDNIEVGVVHAGGIIGEMAFAGAVIRSATVVALTDIDVLVLNASEFRQLLENFPRVAANVDDLRVQRLHELSLMAA